MSLSLSLSHVPSVHFIEVELAIEPPLRHLVNVAQIATISPGQDGEGCPTTQIGIIDEPRALHVKGSYDEVGGRIHRMSGVEITYLP